MIPLVATKTGAIGPYLPLSSQLLEDLGTTVQLAHDKTKNPQRDAHTLYLYLSGESDASPGWFAQSRNLVDVIKSHYYRQIHPGIPLSEGNICTAADVLTYAASYDFIESLKNGTEKAKLERRLTRDVSVLLAASEELQRRGSRGYCREDSDDLIQAFLQYVKGMPRKAA